MLPMQTMYSTEGWDSFSWGFLAESNEVEVIFHHPQTQKDQACGPIIDLVALKSFTLPKKSRGDLLATTVVTSTKEEILFVAFHLQMELLSPTDDRFNFCISRMSYFSKSKVYH